MPDIEDTWCWMQRGALNPDGDPIRIEIAPVCFRERDHSGNHRSHPGAGHGEQIEWAPSGYDRRVPETLRFKYWQPAEGEILP